MTDELLQWGYDSLDALKLVNMEDLSSQQLPMGQRRLIFHNAQALTNNDITSCQTGSKGSIASVTTGNAGFPLATGQPVQQPPATTTTTNQQVQQPPDRYSQTLLNSLLSQQSQLSVGACASNVNLPQTEKNGSRTAAIME